MDFPIGKDATRPTLFLLLLMLAGCSPQRVCRVEPEFFCSEFLEIEAWIGPAQLATLESKFAEDTSAIHYAIGQDVRNRLQLWSDNETTLFFRANGVAEPDSMSYGVTIGLEKFRRGELVDMVAICRQLAAPPPPPPPPPQ